MADWRSWSSQANLQNLIRTIIMKLQHRGYSGTVHTGKDGSVSIDLKLPDGRSDIVRLQPDARVFRKHPDIDDVELFKYTIDLYAECEVHTPL